MLGTSWHKDGFPLAVIHSITRDIFAVEASVETECDPSYPDYQWQVVNVICGGELHEVMEKQTIWLDRTFSALGHQAARFSLCIYPPRR